MKHLQHTTAILLVALLLASCGNGTATVTEQDTTADTQGSIVETEAEEGRQYMQDNLPDDLDFAGATLRIKARGGDEDVRSEFYAEEATGEVVNDAVYERNNLVMERLNVVVETTLNDCNRHTADLASIRQAAMGGTDEYTLIAEHMSHNVTLTVEGLYQDLQTMPYLDFDMPWWNDGFLDTSRVEGRNYLSMGELSQTMISGTYAMFYNKTLYDEHFTDGVSLYDVVRDGAWTLDAMLSICGEMYQDTNGNGEADEGDLFGNYYRNQKMLGSDAYVGGCNIQLLTFDENGNLQYNGNGERMMTFLEKLTKLIFEGNNTYRGEYNDETIMVPLLNRISLFVPWMLGATSYLRDMEDDYAIIPMPKLDENQSDYSATIHNGATSFGILITCQNTELASAALEALCAESYRRVTPAYFDVALKGKYSRDTDTAEMLDLLMDSICPDLTTVYGGLLGSPLDMIRGFFSSENENSKAVSKLAATEQTMLTKMETILEDYAKLQ